MTRNSEIEPRPRASADKDEAFWLIIVLRLLQGVVILALWYFGPWIIKASEVRQERERCRTWLA
jgi:hypothetical protein